MAKANFKDILLKKGEKIAIGVGIGVGGLLLLLGLKDAVVAESPADTVKKLTAGATRVNSAINSPGSDAEPLPEWVTKTVEVSKPVNPQEFAAVGPTFEPVHTPDFLKENPRVMPIVNAQFDIIQAPMVSLDISGEGDKTLIGVVTTRQVGEKDKQKVANEVQNMLRTIGSKREPRTRRQPPQQPPRPPGFGPGGGQPSVPGGGRFGMGGPGGPPGMGGLMGGRPGGPPGMGGGMGSPDGGGNPYGMMGSMMGGQLGGQRDDKTVKYVTPEEAEKSGLPLAQTVYPLRAVMVQAAFPLKAQIEEIRRALRLPKDQHQLVGGGTAPGFPGAGPGGGGYGPMSPGGGGLSKPSMPGAGLGGPGGPAGGMAGPGGPFGSGFGASQNALEPVFDGIDVERRVIPQGVDITQLTPEKLEEQYPWAPYDHETDYFTKIRARKWEDEPDTGYTLYFLRGLDQKLTAPRPKLADELGQYPDRSRMKEIIDDVEKLKKANQQPITLSEFQKRFGSNSGGDNPYAPVGGNGAGTGGYFSGYGGGMSPGPGGPAGGEGGPSMPRRPFGPGAPGGGEGVPGSPGGFAQNTPPEVEHLLIRFFDVSVNPGYSYQYRIRVRMKNPNFGHAKEVARPDDAKREVLVGPWVAINDLVSLPPESHLYAYDSEEYLKHVQKLYEDHGRDRAIRNLMEYNQVQDGKRAVVQFQAWLPQVRMEGSNRSEPIGAWVAAEMPVARGEYIGRRQLVELPLWSAGAENYVLRELSGGVKVYGMANQKNQPKGWPVNFHTLSVLVDFEGGKTRTRVSDHDVTDEAATELLIVRPDGKLLVHNSKADEDDPLRTGRQKTWDEWLTRVRARKDNEPSGPARPGDPFGRFKPGGGAGGPGGGGSGS